MRKAKKECLHFLSERDNNLKFICEMASFYFCRCPENLTANVFNSHILSMARSLTEPWTTVYVCSNLLHDFCRQAKTRGQDPFVIPYLSVGKLKKSSGLDGISNQLLKLSLPYIIDSLTYIFNLCIEKNFQSELLKAKVVLLPKYNDKTIPTN